MKHLVIIVFAVLLLWSCGNKTQFTINGEVVPESDGTIILYSFVGGKPAPVDSATMTAGKFVFTGDAELPELSLIGMEGKQGYIAQLFVEHGTIDMTIYPDSFNANVITGSESQDIFKIYMEEMVSFTKSENDLKRRFSGAQSMGNEDELNAVRFEYETMVENTKLYAKNFIAEYSESPVAAYVYLMNFFQQAPVEELDSILNVFQSIKGSEFVSVIQERADVLRTSEKGSLAPDFTLNDPDGNEVTLSSLRGKYVLIDFWASWCQPCMQEMPNVIEQYKNYKDKGFEIIGVSLDRDRNAWVNTIKAKEMNWIHGWDMDGKVPGTVANKYGVTGIPHTVLLDKEGKIIVKNLRGSALKAKLAELMD
jgi:peroxiredoxin